MSEFENLQRIIRLKRFETPGEDFVEDFLASFHQRQRAELLRQSARGLLWERMTTFWENMVSPKWTAAAVTACVAVVAAWGTVKISGSGQSFSDQGSMLASSDAVPAALVAQPAPLAVESELIREVEQGRQLEIESILLSRHFEGDEVIQPAADVVSVSGAAMPVSVELLPLAGFNR
jgi:negative regulator of sigma E activity